MPVVVVSTGGTIASTEDSGGDAAPDLSGDELVAAVPGLDRGEVRTEDFSTIPSPQFSVEQMYDLASLVREFDDDPDVEGVVVTQGTDTLEETAYFLDLCYDGDTPVVVTGAMRNPSLAGPDGPANLLASVRTAQDERAGEAGVLVTFADRVLPAREATKTHTQQVDTFRSPEFGPLGAVEEERVVWRRAPSSPDPTMDPDRDRLTNDVATLYVTADMPPGHVRALDDPAAVCMAATGAGHFPEGLIDPLSDLREAGVPLVATSRCPQGRLARATYDFPGSEQTLQDLGAYYSDLNVQKTRIRTIVALAADAMDEAFERP